MKIAVLGRASRLRTGATVLRINDEPDLGHYAAAMQDPEGDEFDIV
ncbi:hypothetical protein [Amycolatopsis sp. NPDC003676]